jgi:hypothetical protein
MAQMVELLQVQGPWLNPQHHQKKKRINYMTFINLMVSNDED